MFGGGGLGVGLSTAVLNPSVLDPADLEALDLVPADLPGRPARLSEVFPPGLRSDQSLASELQQVVRLQAALAAYQTELVVELGSRRPDSLDVPTSSPGCAVHDDQAGLPELVGTSEFLADELALILNCSRAAATALIGQAYTLHRRLPATLASLADGVLDWPRAGALAAELGRPADETDPRVVAEVEAAVLPQASALSVRQLRDAARRELIARDAAAAELRRRQAEQAADVTVRPLDDGLAELVALLPVPTALALRDTVDRLARMLRADGDARPIGMLRAEVLRDLVLRPWDTSRPPVTAAGRRPAPLLSDGRPRPDVAACPADWATG